MRTRKKKWTASELETNERIIHNAKALKGTWKEYFGNENPIHLEIGCGKGRFIKSMAEANQDINYVALERDETILGAAARLGKNEKNLAFILGDVENLPDYFGKSEISRLYIQFCDPWPNKKKWAKRRLTHVNFLEMYKQSLAKQGIIYFKTDNRQLFEFSINQFSESGWIMRNVSLDLHNSPHEPEEIFPMTEYEEKFMSQGNPIYHLEAVYERNLQQAEKQNAARALSSGEEQALRV